MKRLVKFIYVVAGALCLAVTASAQVNYSLPVLLSDDNIKLKSTELTQRKFVIMEQRYNRGVNLGLDSYQDSVAIVESNRRMDSIRMHRPTVGLVLSGGGAKGAAHVGVIKYLEELSIPVDLVVGTSMGGLVGGLYSLGYNASQMDSIIRDINWDVVMKDKIARKYIPFSEIRYREKYLLSFPFHYEETEENTAEPGQNNRVKYAVDKKASFKQKIMSAVPFGYIYGHNVNDLLKGLSIGYHDSLAFNKLPIPYACVATDMVSGQGKVWHNGNLPLAMRSTMSIPGVFAPIKFDGMVLVDGGMRDNYPTDLAKRMGADIVIGVTLSSGFYDYDDINNLLDLVNAGVDMMGREAYELNVNIPDVTIKPELTGYNMMSFDSKSIDTILLRGYQAAIAKGKQLDSLKRVIGPETHKFQAHKALDTSCDSIYISNIKFYGINNNEQLVLRKKMPFSENMYVTRGDIEAFESCLLGLGAFEYVSYNLYNDGVINDSDGKSEVEDLQFGVKPEDRSYELVFNCDKAPIDKFGVGIRFDSEELVTATVNLGLGVHRIRGSRHDINLKISSNPHLEYTYSYDAPKIPTFNAYVSCRWTDMKILDFSNGNRLNLKYLQSSQKVYMSNLKWKYLDINLGLQNDVWYFPEGKAGVQGPMEQRYYDGSKWTDYLGLYCDARAYTMDDGYFPYKGVDAGISYMYTFARFPSRSAAQIDNFHSFKAAFKGAFTMGNIFTLLPSVEFSVLLGKEMPLVYGNFIGGTIRGRYIDQQIPFIGTNGLRAMEPFLLMGGLDMRFNLGNNHYLSGVVDYARDGHDMKDWVSYKLGYFGAALQYAYDSIVGPISVNVHWSNLYNCPVKKQFGLYVNFGYHF